MQMQRKIELVKITVVTNEWKDTTKKHLNEKTRDFPLESILKKLRWYTFALIISLLPQI